MFLETAISLVGGLADGFSLYDSVSTLFKGDKNKKLLEQMNCHLERISDNMLLAGDYKGVTDTTKAQQNQITNPREVRQLLEPLQHVTNEEIISSALINTPDKMINAMDGNPWEVLHNITPAVFAQQPNDPTMVPVMFEHGGTRYIGWQKKGTLPILFNCELHDLSQSHLPPPVIRSKPETRWQPGKVFCDAPFAPEMVVIPAGKFMMGTDALEIKALKKQYGVDYFEREHPQHEVTISKPFAMGRYAVTRGEFKIFVDATGHKMPDEMVIYEDSKWEMRKGRSYRNPGFAQSDDHPVVGVSWEDAQAYIRWLNGKTGQTYRLPSEAEWEYACRAGSDTPFWCGGTISTDQANYDGNYPHNGPKGEFRKKTVPVESFEPNPFGLYQLHGNVWEWCDDWYGDYKKGHQTDPQGPSSGSYRVFRGGSWSFFARILRSANRGGDSPGSRGSDLGFRLLRQPS